MSNSNLNLELFFTLLWRKREIVVDGQKVQSSCPHIFVPETVLYQWKQPSQWFSCVAPGQMQRAKREKISNRGVVKAMVYNPVLSATRCNSDDFARNCRELEQDEIIAYHIAVEKREDGSEIGSIEYFNLDQLNTFLYYRQKSFSGVLQRFIECKGDYERVYKVSWIPSKCRSEVCSNLHKKKDPRFPLEDKIVTYEGAAHLSETCKVYSDLLRSEFEKMCNAIAEHYDANLRAAGKLQKLVRMVLYLRIDNTGRPWLMFPAMVKFGPVIVDPYQKLPAEDAIQHPMALRLAGKAAVAARPVVHNPKQQGGKEQEKKPHQVSDDEEAGQQKKTERAPLKAAQKVVDTFEREKCPSCQKDVVRASLCWTGLFLIIDFYGLDFSFLPLAIPSPIPFSTEPTKKELMRLQKNQALAKAETDAVAQQHSFQTGAGFAAVPPTLPSARGGGLLGGTESMHATPRSKTTEQISSPTANRDRPEEGATTSRSPQRPPKDGIVAFWDPGPGQTVRPIFVDLQKSPEATIERLMDKTRVKKFSLETMEKSRKRLGPKGSEKLLRHLIWFRKCVVASFKAAKDEGRSIDFLRDLRDAQADTEQHLAIPSVLQAVFPTMSVDQFVACCQDPAWLYSSIQVCEECFLRYTALCQGDTPANAYEAKTDLKAQSRRRMFNVFRGGVDRWVRLNADLVRFQGFRTHKILRSVKKPEGFSATQQTEAEKDYAESLKVVNWLSQTAHDLREFLGTTPSPQADALTTNPNDPFASFPLLNSPVAAGGGEPSSSSAKKGAKLKGAVSFLNTVNATKLKGLTGKGKKEGTQLILKDALPDHPDNQETSGNSVVFAQGDGGGSVAPGSEQRERQERGGGTRNSSGKPRKSPQPENVVTQSAPVGTAPGAAGGDLEEWEDVEVEVHGEGGGTHSAPLMPSGQFPTVGTGRTQMEIRGFRSISGSNATLFLLKKCIFSFLLFLDPSIHSLDLLQVQRHTNAARILGTDQGLAVKRKESRRPKSPAVPVEVMRSAWTKRSLMNLALFPTFPIRRFPTTRSARRRWAEGGAVREFQRVRPATATASLGRLSQPRPPWDTGGTPAAPPRAVSADAASGPLSPLLRKMGALRIGVSPNVFSLAEDHAEMLPDSRVKRSVSIKESRENETAQEGPGSSSGGGSRSLSGGTERERGGQTSSLSVSQAQEEEGGGRDGHSEWEDEKENEKEELQEKERDTSESHRSSSFKNDEKDEEEGKGRFETSEGSAVVEKEQDRSSQEEEEEEEERGPASGSAVRAVEEEATNTVQQLLRGGVDVFADTFPSSLTGSISKLSSSGTTERAAEGNSTVLAEEDHVSAVPPSRLMMSKGPSKNTNNRQAKKAQQQDPSSPHQVKEEERAQGKTNQKKEAEREGPMKMLYQVVNDLTKQAIEDSTVPSNIPSASSPHPHQTKKSVDVSTLPLNSLSSPSQQPTSTQNQTEGPDAVRTNKDTAGDGSSSLLFSEGSYSPLTVSSLYSRTSRVGAPALSLRGGTNTDASSAMPPASAAPTPLLGASAAPGALDASGPPHPPPFGDAFAATMQNLDRAYREHERKEEANFARRQPDSNSHQRKGIGKVDVMPAARRNIGKDGVASGAVYLSRQEEFARPSLSVSSQRTEILEGSGGVGMHRPSSSRDLPSLPSLSVDQTDDSLPLEGEEDFTDREGAAALQDIMTGGGVFGSALQSQQKKSKSFLNERRQVPSLLLGAAGRSLMRRCKQRDDLRVIPNVFTGSGSASASLTAVTGGPTTVSQLPVSSSTGSGDRPDRFPRTANSILSSSDSGRTERSNLPAEGQKRSSHSSTRQEQKKKEKAQRGREGTYVREKEKEFHSISMPSHGQGSLSTSLLSLSAPSVVPPLRSLDRSLRNRNESSSGSHHKTSSSSLLQQSRLSTDESHQGKAKEQPPNASRHTAPPDAKRRQRQNKEHLYGPAGRAPTSDYPSSKSRNASASSGVTGQFLSRSLSLLELAGGPPSRGTEGNGQGERHSEGLQRLLPSMSYSALISDKDNGQRGRLNDPTWAAVREWRERIHEAEGRRRMGGGKTAPSTGTSLLPLSLPPARTSHGFPPSSSSSSFSSSLLASRGQTQQQRRRREKERDSQPSRGGNRGGRGHSEALLGSPALQPILESLRAATAAVVHRQRHGETGEQEEGEKHTLSRSKAKTAEACVNTGAKESSAVRPNSLHLTNTGRGEPRHSSTSSDIPPPGSSPQHDRRQSGRDHVPNPPSNNCSASAPTAVETSGRFRGEGAPRSPPSDTVRDGKQAEDPEISPKAVTVPQVDFSASSGLLLTRQRSGVSEEKERSGHVDPESGAQQRERERERERQKEGGASRSPQGSSHSGEAAEALVSFQPIKGRANCFMSPHYLQSAIEGPAPSQSKRGEEDDK
uniref:Uncharacterized protein n=1 Tax=Chromera velia CCMP2878 TaxID=1169474 RepID=A0A0G4HZ35_9ALVE|eukprot:Cvel_9639.t1-p1 / transcript=Cvel_9639.t1 / gene=Cvel_9639 / organism=Chromera_velia_CCMP2878 / gene_product=hypothetical protein / transcript_product=hypothetical protein / location=Cvel_scaffold560:49908-60431(+) / protein_length=2388 / sequence_SO=supercontig / SO=protein_coding / is_pseudo=false